MLFNSLEFLIFFPVVTILYFLLPYRHRLWLLLTSSVVFYMAGIPVYIFILALMICIDYVAGLLIESANGGWRKFFLIVSIISNCGLLAFFKYYNFTVENINAAASFIGITFTLPLHEWLLPIGLSFHTFQAMSYTIEVYRGGQTAERHFGRYALYVLFYPQLVAGPIERPQNLLHQFIAKHDFDYDRVTDGLRLMCWGLFKKVVIADNLAVYVDAVYNNPRAYSGLPLIIATVCFAFQIFCDFSGYSDIAIGAARVMGIDLMTNFRRPYHARSISDFWRRWHISLSTWFRDYLYLPLGGNRVSKPRWYFNLFFVFLVSGIWHGANWTFVIWGALNGFYLLCSIWTSGFRERIARKVGLNRAPLLQTVWQVAFTFTLICFTWIFFRANNIADSFYIATHLLSPTKGPLISGGDPSTLLKVLLAIALMEFVHLLQTRNSVGDLLTQRPFWVRWPIYYIMVFFIIYYGSFNDRAFIYFQF